MTVKQTYLVLRDGLKVAGHFRPVGELIPEAKDWENIGPWVREKYIEPITVDQETLDAHFKKYPLNAPPVSARQKRVVRREKSKKKRVVIRKKETGNGQGRQVRELDEQSV